MEKQRRYEQLPILSWFTVTDIPEGEAPEAIRKSWIGVTLPSREDTPVHGRAGIGVLSGAGFDVEHAVSIRTDDAIIALRGAGKHVTADWWQKNWVDKWGGEPPNLLFETDWGEQRLA
jgi:hypothetical protein